ncbi:MAG: cytochrome c peroxidase [Pseudohongiellaceae bacterium]
MAVILIAAVLGLAGHGFWQYVPAILPAQWTAEEINLLQSLSLSNLGDLPPDPGNRLSGDIRAAELGRQLFFDLRLSGNGTIACTTCHRPDLHFTDARSLGLGTAIGDRHTMGLIGVAYSPWHYWDGRKDSLWSQALEPLENPLEQASNRTDLVRALTGDSSYRHQFEQLLGPLPDFVDLNRFPAGATPLGNDRQKQDWNAMSAADRYLVSQVFSAVGKVLAAYERQLSPQSTPFDEYVARLADDPALIQESALSRSQVAGLRLFIGKAQCINCHNGPLFSNHDFHNTGLLSAPGMLPGIGRAAGLETALQDEFNCLGQFSDAAPQACTELRFARHSDANLGAMKTPGLRNVAETAPYMHAGQLASLAEVVHHYDVAADAMVGHNEAKPLKLRAVERAELESFLHALTALPDPQSRWLTSPARPQ